MEYFLTNPEIVGLVITNIIALFTDPKKFKKNN
jgi:hypothetical protein